MQRLNYNSVESTPFVYFDIPATKTHKGGWFRLYWSARSGTYGNQVYFEGNDHNKEDGYFCGKTGGCGYSKEASALNDCLKALGFKAPTCHYEARHLFSSYEKNTNGEYKNKTLHKGGNYFEGTATQIKKFLKVAK